MPALKSNREKFLLFAALAVGVVFILFRGIWVPLRADSEDLDQRRDKTEFAIKKNRKILRETSVDQSYVQSNDRWTQKQSDLKEVNSIRALAEKIAKDIGLQLKNVKAVEIKTFDFYKEVPAEATLEAPLEKLMEFLYQLQDPANNLSLSEISIQRKSPDAQILQCRIVIGRLFMSNAKDAQTAKIPAK